MELLSWRIVIVDANSPVMRKIDQLVFEGLYRDYGVAENGPWHADTAHGAQAAALYGERVLGSALLLGAPGARKRQIRQVVVEPAIRRSGIGRALVAALESHAVSAGTDEIWLNAREDAFRFYERLGYEYESELFDSELTGLPHRSMRKVLGTTAP